MAQYDILLTQNVHATLTEYSEKFVNISKGDLLSADASNVPTVLSAGTNTYILQLDNTETTGLKWVDPDTLGVSVANQGNDRLITATAVSNDLNAEQYLTYNTTQGLGILQGQGIVFASAAATYKVYTADGSATAHLTLQTGNNSSGAAGDITLKAGAGTSSGGDVYFQRDTNYGNFYFGTGAAGHLPARSSEVNVVYYDSSTGLVTYGEVIMPDGAGGADTRVAFYVGNANTIGGDARFVWTAASDTLTIGITDGTDPVYTQINKYEFTIYEYGVGNLVNFDPDVSDGASALAFEFNTVNTLATSGAKLVSVQNDGSEKFAISPDGDIIIPATAKLRLDGSGTGSSYIYEQATGRIDIITASGKLYANYSTGVNASTGHWHPTATDTYDIGATTAMWGNAYFTKDLVFKERSDHAVGTPAATYGYLWVKDDTPNKLYFTDDAGTDHDLTAGGSSPLTTKGDIYTYSTQDARLGVGTNYYTLIADSAETTGLKWSGMWKEDTNGLTLVTSADHVGIGAASQTQSVLHVQGELASAYIGYFFNDDSDGYGIGIEISSTSIGDYLISAVPGGSGRFFVYATGYLYAKSDTASGYTATFYQDNAAGDVLDLETDATTSSYYLIRAYSASVEKFNVRANGYVGIAGAGSSSYALYVTGTIYATVNISAYSDVRYKDIIAHPKGVLDRYDGLNPFIFRFKHGEGGDDGHIPQYGYSAQEILKQFPDAVTYDKERDRYGIKLGSMVALNTLAIKETKTRVEELEEKITELETELNQYKNGKTDI